MKTRKVGRPKGSSRVIKDIVLVRVVGVDERFEIGKSWDSRGRVDRIAHDSAGRITIRFSDGHDEYLENCPVVIVCSKPKPKLDIVPKPSSPTAFERVWVDDKDENDAESI